MKDRDDDISIEKEDLDDSVVSEESQAESIKKLRTRLKECEAKAKEYLDGWQRAQADFANMRKRDEEAKQEFVKFASLNLVKDLIPVLDSFNIAISSGHKDLEPIRDQLLSALKSHGLEETEPLGDPFDPSTSEAVGIVETAEEEEDHKVLEVVQRGYRLGGKMVRAAKVRIGEYKK